MKQDDGHLSTVIGYRLKEAQALLRSRMDAELRPLDLTTPQYACLELLNQNPGASNSELARGAFVTRQTMNSLLQGLHNRGLVERASKAPSGRSLPTTLTPEGKKLLNQALGRIRAVEQQMTSELSNTQSETLLHSLTQCIAALRQ